jgi:D-arabinose 1-dehydrogenase-like Zn-dependent alcohol dehydrogenase
MRAAQTSEPGAKLHIGIQFASKFGYRVAAVGRGPETAALAKRLGGSVYIDSKSERAAQVLQSLGGLHVVLRRRNVSSGTPLHHPIWLHPSMQMCRVICWT